MFNLQKSLIDLCETYGYKLNNLGNDQYSFVVAFKLADDIMRYQLVYISVSDIGRAGKKCISVLSRIGVYGPNIDLYDLLKEAAHGRYSMITIGPDKDPNGNPCETILVKAAPQISTLNAELLKDIVFEVAENADFLENKFYGHDIA